MIFVNGASKDGPYIFGYGQGWHWSKNKGSHSVGRDFFWVHWEISHAKPNSVKLHVECPNAATDPELNAIKLEMVQAFLSAEFKNIIEEHDFTYITGRKSKQEGIKQNKSTQPFRVVLTAEQNQDDYEANIRMINAVTNELVQAVINRFTAQLNRHFSA